MNYYNEIASGYDELHKEEQLQKLAVIKDSGIVREDDVLLDVGCGTGFSLDYFMVKEAHGIDPAAKLAAQYAGSHDIQVAAAESIPYEDDAFDVVISVTAMQNFSDLKKGLEEICRVGKDRFALTILKRSTKVDLARQLMSQIFADLRIRELEEERDSIFLISP